MILKVQDLINKNKEKGEMKKKAFHEILEKCYNKISAKNSMGHETTTFDIPMVYFGYPLYNPKDVMTYIIRKLQKGGFKVYINNNTLIIVWQIDVEKPKPALKKKVKFKSNIEETHEEPPVIRKKEQSGRLTSKELTRKMKDLEKLREAQMWG